VRDAADGKEQRGPRFCRQGRSSRCHRDAGIDVVPVPDPFGFAFTLGAKPEDRGIEALNADSPACHGAGGKSSRLESFPSASVHGIALVAPWSPRCRLRHPYMSTRFPETQSFNNRIPR
jgi:hypothetical protein